MARYRIGESPETGDTMTETIFTGAGIFGLLAGVGFVYAGWRGKQYWLLIWGAGLVIVSLVYLGYKLFG